MDWTTLGDLPHYQSIGRARSRAMIDGVIGNKLLAPNMRLASQPSEKGPKQQLGINAVRLCAAQDAE
jgi:hypothetical protein